MGEPGAEFVCHAKLIREIGAVRGITVVVVEVTWTDGSRPPQICAQLLDTIESINDLAQIDCFEPNAVARATAIAEAAYDLLELVEITWFDKHWNRHRRRNDQKRKEASR